MVSAGTENGNWPDNAVIYHLFVRSFKDSNADGIGDLTGVIRKLDYLKSRSPDSINVDAIWLSPINTSPMKDVGYDISNYRTIDPLYGNLKIFRKLIRLAHSRGIRIIMDYVPNHTSDTHPWFLESKSSPQNPKRDWYIWQNPRKNGKEPNNWISVFGGSAWNYDEETNQYYLHTFDKSQPDLNWRNPEVIESMLNILKYWLDVGVDGFRIDAPYFMFKSKEFLNEPENPAYDSFIHEPHQKLIHPHTFGLPEALDILKLFAETIDKHHGRLMITEVYAPIDELFKMYNAVSKSWFSPFNFMFIQLPWKASVHKEFISRYDCGLGKKNLPNYVLGNHDQHRIFSRIGKEQARNAAILLFTLRGIAFVYYGDEIGMSDGKITPEYIHDPFGKNIRGFSWGRDPQRTPMQWNRSKFAGFSIVDPWLPVNKNYHTHNVQNEKKSQESLLSLYINLINLKKHSESLSLGKFHSLDASTDDVFAYERSSLHETFMIVLNYSDKYRKIFLPYPKGSVILNSSLTKAKGKVLALQPLVLKPNEGIIIKRI